MSHISQSISNPDIFCHGDIELNFATRAVTRKGEPVKLKPMEFAILALLMQNTGQPLTYLEIYQRVSHRQTNPLRIDAHIKNSVQVQICTLRNALGKPNLIQADDNKGYSLSVDGEPVPMRIHLRGGVQQNRYGVQKL